jgi:hypothetical protein
MKLWYITEIKMLVAEKEDIHKIAKQDNYI